MVDDTEDDSKDEGPVEWVSYWKPNMTINLVADFTQYVSFNLLNLLKHFFLIYMFWFMSIHNFHLKLMTVDYYSMRKSYAADERDCQRNWPSFNGNYFGPYLFMRLVLYCRGRIEISSHLFSE